MSQVQSMTQINKSDRWHQQSTYKVIGQIYSNTHIPMQVYTHTPDSQVQTVSYLLESQIICKYYKSLTSYSYKALEASTHGHLSEQKIWMLYLQQNSDTINIQTTNRNLYCLFAINKTKRKRPE